MTGMLQVLFAESASAYMGGIRTVVGASIEEEEAANSLSSAPLVVVTPQPRLASNAATEKGTSRPGPPVSFEPSNDSAGALFHTVYRKEGSFFLNFVRLFEALMDEEE